MNLFFNNIVLQLWPVPHTVFNLSSNTPGFCKLHCYYRLSENQKKPLLSSQELKDPQCRDEMAAARGALKKNATMLYTASQAFLRHPDVAATRANRDYVFKQVQEAIGGISSAAQATSPTDEKHGHAGIGELAAALNEFDVSQQAFLYCFKNTRLNHTYIYHVSSTGQGFCMICWYKEYCVI